MTVNTKNAELLPYYYSTDANVTMGRELVEELEKLNLLLENEHKNLILTAIVSSHSKGHQRGQARAGSFINEDLKEVVQGRQELLSVIRRASERFGVPIEV